MIRALVINLARYPERWAFQQQQLIRLDIAFERLAAVGVAELTDEDYRRWTTNWERLMRPVEVACFLSHQKAWQRVEDSQAPWLILEDDALMANDTSAVLSALSEQYASQQLSADLITLEAHGRKKLVSKRAQSLTKDYQLRNLYQDRTGAAGYILFPSGATQLLQRVNKHGAALADALISSTYSLAAYQVEPAPIIQLDQTSHYHIPGYTVPASIIANTTPNKSLDVPATCVRAMKKRRLLGQCRMGLRFWRYPWLADRREIVVDADKFTS